LLNNIVDYIMEIKDYRWTGFVYRDILTCTPSIDNSNSMTLMYVSFKMHIVNALS